MSTPGPTADELQRACRFVDGCQWTYAASVPAHPHFYVARSWLTAVQRREFDSLVALIDRTGYTGRFWQQTWRYLDLGAHSYWSSQSWFGPDAGEPATMLNRRRLDDGQLRLEGVER